MNQAEYLGKVRMRISKREIELFEAGFCRGWKGSTTDYIRAVVIDALVSDFHLSSHEIGLDQLPQEKLLELVIQAAEKQGVSTTSYIRDALSAVWCAPDLEQDPRRTAEEPKLRHACGSQHHLEPFNAAKEPAEFERRRSLFEVLLELTSGPP